MPQPALRAADRLEVGSARGSSWAAIAMFAPVVVAVAFAADVCSGQDHSQKRKEAPLVPKVNTARPREHSV